MSTSTLDVVLAATGGKIVIPIQESAALLSVARQTIRNWSAQGRAPFPTFLQGRCRYVLATDIADYLDRVRGAAAAAMAATVVPEPEDAPVTPPAAEKRRRGRPTRVEQARRAAEEVQRRAGGVA